MTEYVYGCGAIMYTDRDGRLGRLERERERERERRRRRASRRPIRAIAFERLTV